MFYYTFCYFDWHGCLEWIYALQSLRRVSGSTGVHLGSSQIPSKTIVQVPPFYSSQTHVTFNLQKVRKIKRHSCFRLAILWLNGCRRVSTRFESGLMLEVVRRRSQVWPKQLNGLQGQSKHRSLREVCCGKKLTSKSLKSGRGHELR